MGTRSVKQSGADDESHLDSRYFVDGHVYNCPYCKRRHVKYTRGDEFEFDWTREKKCYAFLVSCDSCRKVSLHLSFTDLPIQRSGSFTPDQIKKQGAILGDLDSHIFYSVPSSRFVIDGRIPRSLRELFAEAEGCLKSNFLTGASACARKIVYELAVEQKAQGANYDERIGNLKALHPEIDPESFDTLLTIQQVTSSKVHEEAYDGWQGNHVRMILSCLREVLNEIYVEPRRREDRRKAILALKEEVLGERPEKDAALDSGPTTPDVSEDESGQGGA